jgi:predicted nuclease of restriction endonuclease-like RecB superfamily
MKQKILNPTKIAEHFCITKYQVNPILSELGFIKKENDIWKLTDLGENAGGIERMNNSTKKTFVVWDEKFLENKTVIDAFQMYKGEPKQDFREKFKAEFRAQDGHYVRSKAEMLIDNWLYMSGIVHAYERKLPIEEEVYCDFYLPHGKVYIEYWGFEKDEKYLERKDEKLSIYQKYNFSLIELTDIEIQNLDDLLPKMLLKFGIQSY